MGNAMAEAGAEFEAMARAQVQAQTFGHLAPQPRYKYQGCMVFCHSEYGDIICIKEDFPGLPSNPWFFADMNDYIGKLCCPSDWGKEGLEQGYVYRWNGWYMKFKNGNFRFSGNVEKIEL